jgi:hypothetical protein
LKSKERLKDARKVRLGLVAYLGVRRVGVKEVDGKTKQKRDGS